MAALNAVFDILRKERRRYALYYLQEANGPVPVDELVAAVLSWEQQGAPETHLGSFKQAKIEFQQVHLPKTTDIGFIEYRPETGTIEVEAIPPEYEAIITIAKLIE